MENKKSYGKTILMVLLLLVTIVAVVVATWAYAKYTSTVDATGSATVAKWSFAVNGDQGATFESVALTDTTLNSKVTTGKIAPGTDGSFSMAIDASGSDVAVDYVVRLSNVQNKPTNLKFYTDATFENELVAVGGVYSITGSIALAEVNSQVNIPIYWKWEYETVTTPAVMEGEEVTTPAVLDDGTDTTEGMAAAEMTFDVTIIGTQQDPRS